MSSVFTVRAVSYTHLDVYKRQEWDWTDKYEEEIIHTLRVEIVAVLRNGRFSKMYF